MTHWYARRSPHLECMDRVQENGPDIAREPARCLTSSETQSAAAAAPTDPAGQRAALCSGPLARRWRDH